ncbi:MAG: ribonuclease Z [Flavobacteriales bacterium]|nr:ribonuclease Z [Flavobacteriales bacterium]MBK7085265.1 ribonuclease Z [Flavobacteriales bacterium]MBK7270647.1 ribonuclease Z [Flavobacteriales bacterium]MBK7754520.1 ribonuclease Z [Flavobacteriales bacterium]MBK9075799.1 ribonuclease Z [Flavobacteriales bacterium]
MRFELTPLGTGAALPARGRSPSAQVVNANEDLYLIDCGEGTQERLRMAGFNFQRIGHLFISHLHGDHYLGVMGLISTMHLLGRDRELHIHAPQELKAIIDIQLQASGTWLRYPLRFHPTRAESGALVWSDAHVQVTALALKHRLPTTGFLFRQQPAPRTLRKETVHLIPHFRRSAIKAGEDLVCYDGTVVPNADLTLDPPLPLSYAYCSDTAYNPDLVPHLNGVDVLYHEATFTEHLAPRARETMHSTARQAATIARDAGVGQLLLGHFSSRYKDVAQLLEEAVTIFPDTLTAEEGRTYNIGRPIVQNS